MLPTRQGSGSLPGQELWEVSIRTDPYGPHPTSSLRVGVTLYEIKCLTVTSFPSLFFDPIHLTTLRSPGLNYSKEGVLLIHKKRVQTLAEKSSPSA